MFRKIVVFVSRPGVKFLVAGTIVLFVDVAFFAAEIRWVGVPLLVLGTCPDLWSAEAFFGL